MIEYFRQLFLTNDIFSGALFAGSALGLLASSRQYFTKMFGLLIERNTVSFNVTSSDDNFVFFLMWLENQNFSKMIKKYHITKSKDKYRRIQETIRIKEEIKDNINDNFVIGPGSGTYFFKYNKKYIMIKSSIEKPTAGGNLTPQVHRSIGFSYLGRNEKSMKCILKDIIKIKKSLLDETPNVYIPDSWGNEWIITSKVKYKNIDYVFLPQGEKEKIVNSIKDFINNEKWYNEYNIPYKTGFLFHGVPGSGKTTLIRAIASMFNLNLYFLPFSRNILSTEKLASLFADIEPDSLIVLEDVDVLFDNKEKRETKEHLNFSTLLNVIDGPTFTEGTILMMTTNHIDKLDPALIRSGRVDSKIEFKYSDSFQQEKLFKHFNKNLIQTNSEVSKEFVDALIGINKISAADIQAHLIKYNGISAINNIDKLIAPVVQLEEASPSNGEK